MKPALSSGQADHSQSVSPDESRDVSSDVILDELLDEITHKLHAGQSVKLEDYVAEFPQLAESLRQIWPGLNMLAELGRAELRNDQSGSQAEPFGAETSDLRTTGFQLENRNLGDFRILREIGRGGMGVVYEADQISLGRQVALKVLPLAGLLDERQLQRFRNEARAAAGLHHAHIVPVFSVGCERGVHYYAMQFIEGESLAELIEQLRQQNIASQASKNDDASPIGQHGSAEAAGPSMAGTQVLHDTHPKAADRTDRSYGDAKWFQSVAQMGIQLSEALEYAHSLGVVHRDIKPANILMDSRGEVWITDFGLAQLEADAGLTMTGDVMGTLRYMSPEQATGERSTMDRRTDIYSLGATLYELLTLRPVFEGNQRRQLLRQVIEDDPISPRRLDQRIPHDLETIILKSLRKTPGERYLTARELADDLQRFLSNEPIRAKRPTVLDRMSKWTRRHATVLAVLAVGLVVGLVGTTWQSFVATQAKRAAQVERDRALEAEREAELQAEQSLIEAARAREAERQADAQAELARTEAARARAVVETIKDILGANNPEFSRRNDLTVRDILIYFASGLDGKLDKQPDVEASLRFVVGEIMRRYGEPEGANAQLNRALELQRQTLGDKHPETAETLTVLAGSIAAKDPDKSVSYLREALSIYEHHGLGSKIISVLLGLHDHYNRTGQHAEREHITAEMMRVVEKFDLWDSTIYTSVLRRRASNLMNQGEYQEAERLARQALEIILHHVDENKNEGGWYWSDLGRVLWKQQRYEEAENCYRRCCEIFSMSNPPGSKSIEHAYNHLAQVMVEQGKGSVDIVFDELDPQMLSLRMGTRYLYVGRWDEAIAEYTRLIELSPDNTGNYIVRAVAYSRLNQWEQVLDDLRAACNIRELIGKPIGEYFLALPSGQLNRAAPELRDPLLHQLKCVIDLLKTDLGHDDHATLLAVDTLAEWHKSIGQDDEAIALWTQIANIRRRSLEGEHLSVQTSINQLAIQYLEVGRLQQAEELLLEVCQAQTDDHSISPTVKGNLATVYLRQGRMDEAETILLDVIDQLQQSSESHDPTHLLLRQKRLAEVYIARGEYADAEALLSDVLSGYRDSPGGKEHPRAVMTMAKLAACLTSQGRHAEAESLISDAVEIASRVFGVQNPTTLDCMIQQARLIIAQDRPEEAQRLLASLLDSLYSVQGEKHPSTLVAIDLMGQSMFYQHLWDDASSHFEIAYQFLQELYGDSHPDTLRTLDWLARCQLAEMRYAEAEQLLRQRLTIEDSRPEENWQQAHARALLGTALGGQSQFAEAEEHLLAAYQILESLRDRIPFGERYCLTQTAEELVALFEASDRPELSQQWRERMLGEDATSSSHIHEAIEN